MRNRNLKVISLLLIWVIGLACSVQNLPSPSATQTPYVIVVTVENTVEVPPIVPTETSVVETQPVDNATPDTNSQVNNPINSESGSPLAVMVGGNIEGNLEVYDIMGNPVGNLSTPGFFANGAGYIHAYGFSENNINSVTAIYLNNDGHTLRQTTNGQTQDLTTIMYLSSMRGLAGTPFLVIGKGSFESSGLSTQLMSYDFSQGVNSRLYSDTISAESRVFAPLYVIGQNGSAEGVWYTKEAYGIGGAILYPVTYGMYYLDLASGNAHWLFNDEYRPMAISRDGSIVAVSHVGVSNIGNMSIYEIRDPNLIVEYPLLMGEDLGAGYPVISPNNQKVAWMEAGGEIMAEQPTFHSVLCYANIAPDAVSNCLPATDLVISAVNYPNSMAKPLGWLNNHQLLFEATTLQEPTPSLRILNITNNQVNDFALGRFVGFIY